MGGTGGGSGGAGSGGKAGGGAGGAGAGGRGGASGASTGGTSGAGTSGAGGSGTCSTPPSGTTCATASPHCTGYAYMTGDVVKARLIRDYGYDDESATDVLTFVASIFARGDVKQNK